MKRIEYSIKLFLNKNLNNIFEKINKINSLGIAITEIREKVLLKIKNKLLIGNKELSQEEITYFIMNLIEKKVKVIQGDRVEHPDYIKSNNLQVDYLFYITNQIMKPSIQF